MICSFYHQLRGFTDYQIYLERHRTELLAQRAYEQTVWAGRSDFHLSGYCAGCRKVAPLKVDLNWGDGIKPNWRERMECACGLNNRVRAALDFLDNLVGDKPEPAIYATEQLTSLYRQLRTRYPKAIGSEFLRDKTGCGLTNAAGIRHEDLTHLSFASASMDMVLSFDVLEHVPDFRTALAEIARVLTPNGYLLASFPFDANQAKTVVRASLTDAGTIVHHLPPEYHGDPVDSSGCLCFQVFGWDVLDEMKSAGFSDAYTVFYWSVDRGYLGPNQLLIIGRR